MQSSVNCNDEIRKFLKVHISLGKKPSKNYTGHQSLCFNKKKWLQFKHYNYE